MEVTFQEHPDVIIATNTFKECRTILQYETTPLIEIGKFVPAGYTTRFPVFHSDGTKIAVVEGSRIHITDEGKKAMVSSRHEQNLIVCELEGKPILELRRNESTSLKGWAELYAPEGILIKAMDAGISALLRSDGPLLVGSDSASVIMDGNTFIGDLGIHITKRGISVGGIFVGGGKII